MQTFLPYPSYYDSGCVLDRARLGKQRVECKQILKALQGETQGWRNHPAVKMWQGHEYALCNYAIAICTEWIFRGYTDRLCEEFHRAQRAFPNTRDPLWLGLPSFHAAHRSNLLRKDPEHYKRFGWTEPENLPYVWPL